MRLNIDSEFPCWWRRYKEAMKMRHELYSIMNACCFSLRFRKAFAGPCHVYPGQVVPQGLRKLRTSQRKFYFVIFVVLLSSPLCCHCPICTVVCLSQKTSYFSQLKRAETETCCLYYPSSVKITTVLVYNIFWLFVLLMNAHAHWYPTAFL